MIGMDIHARDLDFLLHLIERQPLNVKTLGDIKCPQCRSRLSHEARRMDAQLLRIRSAILTATPMQDTTP